MRKGGGVGTGKVGLWLRILVPRDCISVHHCASIETWLKAAGNVPKDGSVVFDNPLLALYSASPHPRWPNLDTQQHYTHHFCGGVK
jgi:hypothetical protein